MKTRKILKVIKKMIKEKKSRTRKKKDQVDVTCYKRDMQDQTSTSIYSTIHNSLNFEKYEYLATNPTTFLISAFRTRRVC